MAVSAIRVGMLVVREENAELRDESCGLAKTRKYVARRVDGRPFDVAVRTDLRDGSFAGEELLAMTVQARSMFGKLRHVRKRSVAFANFLPVLCWNLVTCTTRELFVGDVSGMREIGVINARLHASLSRGRSTH